MLVADRSVEKPAQRLALRGIPVPMYNTRV